MGISVGLSDAPACTSVWCRSHNVREAVYGSGLLSFTIHVVGSRQNVASVPSVNSRHPKYWLFTDNRMAASLPILILGISARSSSSSANILAPSTSIPLRSFTEPSKRASHTTTCRVGYLFYRLVPILSTGVRCLARRAIQR